MANYRRLFRAAPPARLADYFAARAPTFPTDFDWTAKSNALVNSLDAALSELPDALPDRIRAELDSATVAASPDGWIGIDQICRAEGINLDEYQGNEDVILMLVVNHRDLFERAVSASSMFRRHGGRDWYTAIRIDPFTADERKIYQGTMYVEDRPETNLAFGADDALGSQLIKRVNEIGFFFDPSDQLLEICAPGGKTVRDKYARAFADSFVGEDTKPVEIPRREVDFAPISRMTEWVTEPSDRIGRTEITHLSFYSEGGGFVTFERRSEEESIPDFIARRFGSNSPLSASGWRITAATLCIVRSPVDGNGREKRLTVDLKSPNRTTLRNKSDEDRRFVYGLLERWGFLHPTGDEPVDMFEAV